MTKTSQEMETTTICSDYTAVQE
uniref:Uncharacterized protein n=1 Tax=Arundo donax TaxID=35708 RepID=A0A0A8XZD1_ARUDO